MKDFQTKDVLLVRIYTLEGSTVLSETVDYLNNQAKVKGVTVFRAIAGYGDSGKHAASILDFSIKLPMVIEFFDTPEKVKSTIDYLSTIVKSEHILFFNASVNLG